MRMASIVSIAAVAPLLGGAAFAQERASGEPIAGATMAAVSPDSITGEVVDVSALLRAGERPAAEASGSPDLPGLPARPPERSRSDGPGWLAIAADSGASWTLVVEKGMRPAKKLRDHVGETVTIDAEAKAIGGLRLAQFSSVTEPSGEKAEGNPPASAAANADHRPREMTVRGRLVNLEHLFSSEGKYREHTCEAGCIEKSALLGIQEGEGGRLFAIVAGFGDGPKGGASAKAPSTPEVQATGLSVGQLIGLRNIEPIASKAAPEKPENPERP